MFAVLTFSSRDECNHVADGFPYHVRDALILRNTIWAKYDDSRERNTIVSVVRRIVRR